MPSGERRLQQHLTQVRQQQKAPAMPDIPEFPTGRVTAITAGASTDHLNLVTVRYRGADLKLPYLTHYTPVVGDVVALARIGGNPTIIGRPGGFPPAP